MTESVSGDRIASCLVCEVRGWFFPQLQPIAIFDTVGSARRFIQSQPDDSTHYWLVEQDATGLMREATSIKKWRKGRAGRMPARRLGLSLSLDK